MTELSPAAQAVVNATDERVSYDFPTDVIAAELLQRRCVYNPVQIAECGGPCEQGPEHCDCGALVMTEAPAQGEVAELVAWLLEGGEDAAANGWDHQARQFARAAELLQRLQPEPPTDEELTLTYALAVAAAVDGMTKPWPADLCERAQLAGLRAVLARWGTPN